jgi:transposase
MKHPSNAEPSTGKSINNPSSVTQVGLDLAKKVFQVHAIDAQGAVVAKPVRRRQWLKFFATLPPCVVGMEARSSTHH